MSALGVKYGYRSPAPIDRIERVKLALLTGQDYNSLFNELRNQWRSRTGKEYPSREFRRNLNHYMYVVRTIWACQYPLHATSNEALLHRARLDYLFQQAISKNPSVAKDLAKETRLLDLQAKTNKDIKDAPGSPSLTSMTVEQLKFISQRVSEILQSKANVPISLPSP